MGRIGSPLTDDRRQKPVLAMRFANYWFLPALIPKTELYALIAFRHSAGNKTAKLRQ